MTYHFNKLLSAVSVLPALLVLPAMAETSITERQVLNDGESQILSDISALNVNSAGEWGGIFYIDGNTNVTINDSLFDGNTAATSGAIEIREGRLTINNTTFNGNTATTSSGAIETWTRDNVLTINDSVFSNNTALAFGAVSVFGNTGVNTITNTTFTGNSATSTVAGNDGDGGDGGAIFLGSDAKLKIVGSTFGGETAELGNFAAGDGGAISTRTVLQSNEDSGLEIEDSTFMHNVATGRGGAIYSNIGHNTTLDGAASITGSTFAFNSATQGGAIYNDSVDSSGNVATLSVSGSTFSGNTATKGGAIYNSGSLTVTNSAFSNNTATGNSGAIAQNDATAQLTLNNVSFTGNSADWGGAIVARGIVNITGGSFVGNTSNDGGGAIYLATLANKGHKLNINGTTFSNNSTAGVDVDGGGAIGSFSDLVLTNAVFTGNHVDGINSHGGGAVFLGSDSTNDIQNTTFSFNTSATAGGAIGTRWFSDGDNHNATLNVIGGTFENNTAALSGGAIDNYLYHSEVTGYTDSVYVAGSTFSSNTAGNGGAIYNHIGHDGDKLNNNVQQIGNMYIVDSNFIRNVATSNGGAIYNEGVMTIAANTMNVTFNGNTANGVSNDIYNIGTLNLDASSDKVILLNGGIDGDSETVGSNIVNITGNGTVEVSNTLTNQTVAHNNGELHLNDVDLTGSTINVASGATINTIDNLINDYAASIVLSNGAIVMGDLDYADGVADLYSAVDGATIIYNMANPLDIGIQYGASKTIQVATGNNVTVNAGTGFAWFDSDHGLTLTSSGEADGSIIVTGQLGGINAAVAAASDSSLQQEVSYSLTRSEYFDGEDNVIQNSNVYITGNGNDPYANSALMLRTDLTVDENSSLSLSDVVLAQANDVEKIENMAGGVLNIKNSYIGVDIDNAGTLISDPTTYAATVNNTGTATFDADTFESTSVLANSGVANLENGVVFDMGAQITGNGVMNLVSGTTQFNNTASSNTVNVANGANFTGSLASTGVLNTQNNNIDTITGSVSGGTLNIDASLIGAGSVDTFADATGATVNAINLVSSEYGNAATLTMNLSGATLADDVTVTGATNYYTSIEMDDSGNLVFSDKLLNTSGFYTLADATWSGGHYILDAATYENAADDTHLTIGDALAALDEQVYANTTGKIDTTSIYTAAVTDEAVTNSDSLVMSVTSFQNSIENLVENVGVNWVQTQGFEGGVTFGEGALFGITGAGVATLGATTVSSLTLGGVMTSGIDTAVAADSESLITSGAVAAALNGKQDEITSENMLSASLVSGLSNVATSGNASDLNTDATHMFVTNEQITTWDGKQDAINANNMLSAAFISGLSNVATSGNASDLNTDTTHMFVTNEQIASWNGKQDVIDENNMISAAYISGLSAAATTSIDDTVTAESGNLITSGAVAAALDGKQDAITEDNMLAASLIATDSEHQFVTSDQISAWNALVGDGEGSVASQIQTALNESGFQDANDVAAAVTSGAQNATYDASADYADGTIGAAIQSNTEAIAALTGSGEGSIASYVESALDGMDVQTADDVTTAITNGAENAVYNADGEHASGTIGAAIDTINETMGTVHGLVASADATTTTNGDAYHGNLAVGTTVEDHLVSLDAAIGDMRDFDTTNTYATDTTSVAANLTALDSAVSALSLDVANRDALTLSQANAYTDSRIETLDKNLSSGIASAVALSSVAVGGVRRGEMSVGAGYGYFNGQSAAAFGAAVGLSSRWSVNAGAGISGYDVSFRAGTNFKFKVF